MQLCIKLIWKEGGCDETLFRTVADTRGFERPARLGARVEEAAPKAGYDAVIIGGGGHGLATAYYLAKNHGMTNIAVIERDGSAAETPVATPP